MVGDHVGIKYDAHAAFCTTPYVFNSTQCSDTWIVDSGCTDHMISDRCDFWICSLINPPRHIGDDYSVSQRPDQEDVSSTTQTKVTI